MPESLFTALFKYRPIVFENGTFAFEGGPWPAMVFAGLAGAVVLGAMYRRQRDRVGTRMVWTLTGIRVAVLALLLFALLRPALVISRVIPGENFLAVIIDDSRSMQLADEGIQSRGQNAYDAFSPSGEAVEQLGERFTVRHYRFSDVAARMDPGLAPSFQGRSTNIGAALDYVRRDLTGVPLAGMVLVSDGADNADTTVTEPLLQLKSRGIPVYTVGFGEEAFRKDIEVTRIEAPNRVLAGSAFAVDVMIDQRGFDGQTVTLVAEEDGIIAGSRSITFGRGQPGTTARMILVAEAPGTHDYRFSIAPAEDEQVSANNAQSVLLSIEDSRERVLYFEGEPRFEVKFMRQAMTDDPNVHLVVLQRTAENKYLRLGVEDSLELASGFPSTREELFAYRGLILGSVEASYFTHNQLQIIEEFVSQRGGGLMFLGGRASFAEGGYAGTPLENVLPVVLEEPTSSGDFLAEVDILPTASGASHSALQLEASPDASRERWAELPPLTTPNPLYRVKPGASLLLTGRPAEGGDDLVILATQPFGRGRSVALTVQDSWLWQMHADIPLEDLTHERFWRQVSRWLVSSVPDQVSVETPKTQFSPGEPVAIQAEVSDSSYLGINGAEVIATITDPTGAETTVPLEWSVEEDGEYRGTFVPDQLGGYDIRVSAAYGGSDIGTSHTGIRSVDLPTEFFGAERNTGLLRRIAEETGGRFYTRSTLGGIVQDVEFTDSGRTVTETFELWDMPIALLLLLTLLAAEWGVRRRRGLV